MRPAAWFERLRSVPVWKFILWCGIGMAAIFLLVQPFVVGTLLVGDPDWNLPARLLLAQMRSYGIVVWISASLGLLLASRSELPARDAGVLAIMIGVCGTLLWVLSEIERSWRFYWLWPLQTIAVVAVIGSLIRWWKPKPLIAAGLIVLAIALFLPYRLQFFKVECHSAIWVRRARKRANAGDGVDRRESRAGSRAHAGGERLEVRRRAGCHPGLGLAGIRIEISFVTPNATVSDVSPQDDFRIAGIHRRGPRPPSASLPVGWFRARCGKAEGTRYVRDSHERGRPPAADHAPDRHFPPGYRRPGFVCSADRGGAGRARACRRGADAGRRSGRRRELFVSGPANPAGDAAHPAHDPDDFRHRGLRAKGGPDLRQWIVYRSGVSPRRLRASRW